MAGYIFGGNTNETAESVARKRRIAEALRPRGRAPQNIGEGLTSFGGSIASALLQRRADNAEAEGKAAFGEEWKNTFEAQNAPINSTDDLWGRATGEGVGQKPQPTMAQLTQLAGNDFANPMQQQIVASLIGQKLDPQTQKPVALSPGSVLVDPTTGQQIAQGAEKPKPLKDRAVEAWMQTNPGATEMDALQALANAGAARSTTTVKLPPGETKFEEGAGKYQAEMYGKLVDDGFSAQDQLAKVNRLGDLLDANEGGAGTWLKAAGARLGIEIGDNFGEAQAADALIAALVPAQRIPGSGTTSDFDARQFAKSMTSLAGTPEGNRLILQTMSAMLQQRVKRSDIAAQVMTGELSRQEGLRALKALPSPYPSKEEVARINAQRRESARQDPTAPLLDQIQGAGRLYDYQGPQK